MSGFIKVRRPKKQKNTLKKKINETLIKCFVKENQRKKYNYIFRS